MLNEWKEFQDYTGAVNYTARNKQDTTYLGRFTFDTILDFEGLNRVLTILARGFLFHNENGSPAEAPRERIDYAKRGLCAWCSVPDSKKATPWETWQFGSHLGKLHSEFPDLVDKMVSPPCASSSCLCTRKSGEGIQQCPEEVYHHREGF